MRPGLMPTKHRHWFHSPLVAVVLLIIMIWGGITAVSAFEKDREAKKLRDQYARDLAQLESKHAELDQKINTLSTVRGMESEVRNRYRVVKPGEQLVVVVDNRDDSLEKKLQAETFWGKVRNFVGF
jgi:cell division protein FtsB